MVISRDGQSPQASAMEGMLHGNDLMASMSIPVVGVPLGDLESALHRLGAAVGKKHLFHLRNLQKLLPGVNGRLIVE